MPFRVRPFTVAAWLAAALLTVPVGCAGLGLRRPSGPVVTRSADGKKQLSPKFETVVYEASKIAAAEFYLTDLPQGRLLDLRDDLTGLSGSIVQVRLLVVPKAGNTPIGDTACNITVRHLVISAAGGEGAPEVGVYGGGGFLFPGDDPGDSTITGSMSGVSLRPIAWSAGFIDLLGPSELAGGFTARHDDKVARGLAARVQKLMARADQRPAAVDHKTSIASPNE